MKILVCGSRDFTYRHIILKALQGFPKGTILIHGGARGADSIAHDIGIDLGFVVRSYPADWSLGPSAGPRRNQHMIDEEHKVDEPIDLVLAFYVTLGPGTGDMIKRSAGAGIEVKSLP